MSEYCPANIDVLGFPILSANDIFLNQNQEPRLLLRLFPHENLYRNSNAHIIDIGVCVAVITINFCRFHVV